MQHGAALSDAAQRGAMRRPAQSSKPNQSFSSTDKMTRLLLINDTYPGGIVVRCDRCEHAWEFKDHPDAWAICAAARGALYLTTRDFGCPKFEPKEKTSDPE